MDWKPIDTAPWQQIVWVKNDVMKTPIKAVRGYSDERGVHPNNKFFTSVFTEDRFFPTLAGLLVCPTHWAPIDEKPPPA